MFLSENTFTSDAFPTSLSNRRSLRLQIMKSRSFCLAKSMKQSPFLCTTANTSGSGGVVSWLSQVRLKSDTRGLTLVPGLLRDWVRLNLNFNRLLHNLISHGISRMGKQNKRCSVFMLFPPRPQVSLLFFFFCYVFCTFQT